MRLLPKWALLNPPSAIYDLESVTPLQQTARVYGAMNDMIREYNSFADQINKEIVEFIISGETEISNFKESVEERIRCKFEAMDTAFAKMKLDITSYADAKIVDTYQQLIHDEVSQTVSQIVSEKIASGDIEITLVYDPETESLNMTTGEA